MISVLVFINGREIIRVDAVNRSVPGLGIDKVHTYHVSDGRTVKHIRSKGAALLAIKMLKGVANDFEG